MSKNVKKYMCKECTYSSFSRSNFYQHEIRHNKEKNFVCDFHTCKYSTMCKPNLDRHKLKHTRKKFVCEYAYCTFSTIFKYNYTQHKQNHIQKRTRNSREKFKELELLVAETLVNWN